MQISANDEYDEVAYALVRLLDKVRKKIAYIAERMRQKEARNELQEEWK